MGHDEIQPGSGGFNCLAPPSHTMLPATEQEAKFVPCRTALLGTLGVLEVEEDDRSSRAELL